MTKNKRFHTPNFKAQVALELIRGLAMSEVCSRYEIHPTQARRWKEQVLQNFEDTRENIGKYFQIYNYRRLYQSLNYQTPAEVYFTSNNSKVKFVKSISTKLQFTV